MRAVSEETINSARSLTEILGSWRCAAGDKAMDDILASSDLGNGRSVHLASLSRETIVESRAEHLGFQGYFLFEVSDKPGASGINVLGKVASYDAAIRLIELLKLT